MFRFTYFAHLVMSIYARIIIKYDTDIALPSLFQMKQR